MARSQVKRSARLSRCGRYRYALWRIWDSELPRLCIVGLNPSTADATIDDPTIRRCIDFARRWKFGSIAMANLFAFRSTSPEALRASENPVGPANDRWIARLVEESGGVLAAWGNGGSLMGRDRVVRAKLPKLLSLGFTKSGQPRHPLYVAAATQPVLWEL